MRDDATLAGSEALGVEPFDRDGPSPAQVGHQLGRAT